MNADALWCFLRVDTQAGSVEQGGEGWVLQDARCWVHARDDVVGQDGLEELLGRLRCVLRDLGEGLVRWGKDRQITGRCSVEDLDQVIVLADQLCELRGVLGPGNELIDSLLRTLVAMVRLLGFRLIINFVSGEGVVDQKGVCRIVYGFLRSIFETGELGVEGLGSCLS